VDEVDSSAVDLAGSVNLSTALNNLNSVIQQNKSSFPVFLNKEDGGGNVVYHIQKSIISDQIVVDIYGNSLYNMTINGFVLKSELVSTKTIESSSLSSIGDCYRSCKSETAIRCVSFSFCRDFDNSVRCLLSTKLVYEEMPNKTSQVDVDSACNTYVISYLNGYTKLDGQVILSGGDQNLKKKTANLCAKACTFNRKLPCKSFQYCETGQCFLRRKHFLDFNTVNSSSDSALTGCAFYTSK
jgi:hypothetical protein